MICYRELSTLEKDLGVPLKTLFSVSNNISSHYRSVSLPKKNGGTRTLSVPDAVLKDIQRRILGKLLVYRPVSRYATAYKYGSNLAKNAIPHVGKAKILKLDIESFFDSILFSQLKQYAFPEPTFSEPVRVLLSILCYKGDGLPQGAPTSPAISNLVLFEFDERIGAFCKEKKISYTRYCDDMTFSGDFDENEIISEVKNALKSYGLFINSAKTNVVSKGSRQSVTGITVNDKINASKDYRAQIRKEMYFIKKFGIDSHLEIVGSALSPKEYIASLSGRVSFVLSVTPLNTEMRGYKNYLAQLSKQ